MLHVVQYFHPCVVNASASVGVGTDYRVINSHKLMVTNVIAARRGARYIIPDGVAAYGE